MEQSEIFCLKLPARYRNLKLISDAIELLLADLIDLTQQEQVIYGIKLAVHEVANNVIQHAYCHEHGIMEISLQFDPQSSHFTAQLHDTGAAFDKSSTLAPDLDVPHESGYGLFLAEQFMDEVIYQRQPDGNYWQLGKQLS